MSDESKLYKFVKEEPITKISWKGQDNEMLYLWIPYHLLGEFTELFSVYFETENEVMANLQIYDVCIDLTELFDGEFELEKMFPKNEYKY